LTSLILELVFLIAMAVVLWLMIRGRRLPNTPACPSCRYYVRDLNGCICPECGNDLCASGVLGGMRMPVARWIRSLVVVFLAVVLFASYARYVFTPFQDLFDGILGRHVDHSGNYRIEIGFNPTASEIDSIKVEVDGQTNPTLMSDAPENLWDDQMPMHVTLKWHDGRQQELTLRPVLNKNGQIVEWEMHPVTQSKDEPSDNSPVVVDPNKSPAAYPKTVPSSSLDDHVSMWVEQSGPLSDPWDPARFVLARSVSRMQLIHARKASSADLHDLLGESAQAQVSSTIGGNFMTMSRPMLRAHWFIFGLWVVVWVVVLILVLIPNTRYEQWPQRTF